MRLGKLTVPANELIIMDPVLGDLVVTVSVWRPNSTEHTDTLPRDLNDSYMLINMLFVDIPIPYVIAPV